MSAIAVDGHFRGTVNIYWIDENTNWLEVGVVFVIIMIGNLALAQKFLKYGQIIYSNKILYIGWVFQFGLVIDG